MHKFFVTWTALEILRQVLRQNPRLIQTYEVFFHMNQSSCTSWCFICRTGNRPWQRSLSSSVRPQTPRVTGDSSGPRSGPLSRFGSHREWAFRRYRCHIRDLPTGLSLNSSHAAQRLSLGIEPRDKPSGPGEFFTRIIAPNHWAYTVPYTPSG